MSGAVLVALTTSLPESIGEVRVTGLPVLLAEDASMSIETLVKVIGAAERFIAFITGILVSKYDRFPIMYGIRGRGCLRSTICPTWRDTRTQAGGWGTMPIIRCRTIPLVTWWMVIYQYYLYFPGTLDEIEDMFEVVKNIVRTDGGLAEADKGIWRSGRRKAFCLIEGDVLGGAGPGRKDCRTLQKGGYAISGVAEASWLRRGCFHAGGWKEGDSELFADLLQYELDSVAASDGGVRLYWCYRPTV